MSKIQRQTRGPFIGWLNRKGQIIWLLLICFKKLFCIEFRVTFPGLTVQYSFFFLLHWWLHKMTFRESNSVSKSRTLWWMTIYPTFIIFITLSVAVRQRAVFCSTVKPWNRERETFQEPQSSNYFCKLWMKAVLTCRGVLYVYRSTEIITIAIEETSGYVSELWLSSYHIVRVTWDNTM